MTAFRNRDDAVAATLTACSLLVLVGAFLFMVFVPKPTTKGLQTKHDRAVLRSRINMKASDQRLDEVQQAVRARTWTGSAQDVAPAALARVTELARRYNVTLVAFRPQRVIEGTISQLPYLINVEGPFVNVLAFEKAVESPDTRLAVNLVQFTSTEASSDRVSASIGVVAYLSPGPETEVDTTTKESTGGNRA